MDFFNPIITIYSILRQVKTFLKKFFLSSKNAGSIAFLAKIFFGFYIRFMVLKKYKNILFEPKNHHKREIKLIIFEKKDIKQTMDFERPFGNYEKVIISVGRSSEYGYGFCGFRSCVT